MSFSVDVRARDTSASTPLKLLEREVTLMIQETLPAYASSRSRTPGFDLDGYRENLEELRSVLRRDFPDTENLREDVFDVFEDVLDSYSSLVEEVHEGRTERLDGLGEDLEERLERFRDRRVVPRSEWLAEYDRTLVEPASLEGHHRVLVRSFGLAASGFLSGDTTFRLETYLNSMDRVFSDVARELLETDRPPLHGLRYYNSLLTLVEENLDRRSRPGNSTLVDRYLGQLRRQGDLVLRISRTRSQRAPVEELIERMDSILRDRSGHEAGLLDRNR